LEPSSEVGAWWKMERYGDDEFEVFEEAVGGIVATLAEEVKNLVDQRRVRVRNLIRSCLSFIKLLYQLIFVGIFIVTCIPR
jgi:hypothetical protein